MVIYLKLFLSNEETLLTIGITCGNMRRVEGNDLQKRREALGMSRDELAKALQTTSVSIWRWETGERAIPPYLPLALETVERNQKGNELRAAQKRVKKGSKK